MNFTRDDSNLPCEPTIFPILVDDRMFLRHSEVSEVRLTILQSHFLYKVMIK